jgi:hypothetical protein
MGAESCKCALMFSHSRVVPKLDEDVSSLDFRVAPDPDAGARAEHRDSATNGTAS